MLEIIRDEVVYDGQFVRVINRYFKDNENKERVWEIVERKIFGEIVVIAAVTPDKHLVLEKSFRIPSGRYLIELPAGLMDIEGETAEETAHRELLEETGYAAKKLEKIFETPLDQAMNKHKLLFFLGENAQRVSDQRQEDSEHIEVVTVPTKDVFSFVKEHQEKHDLDIDIKLLSVLPLLEERNLL